MDFVNDADDPIHDIIDYLVRCAKISFKNAHVNEEEARTSDKVRSALELYKQSPTNFLLQYGKYMTPHHIEYFDKLHTVYGECYQNCVKQLKEYHSNESRSKRIRNRRYKALQKLQQDSDYFSEKQMMHRNPLLYEQLIGQYLTDEEIKQRDCVDRENLTLLNIILATVDRKHLKEVKNEQLQQENEETITSSSEKTMTRKQHQWGEFESNDTTPRLYESRRQNMIVAPERKLLRDEFLHEMCCSFIEGRDTDIDYDTIDNDEQYDDLHQASQDAEDKYFDSEPNEVENLEEHMKLVEEYASSPNDNTTNDSLDEFMKHLSKKKQN